MSERKVKDWLVAYDIREPRRLRRVHRRIREEGATVQYSAFCVRANDHQISALLQAVAKLIDERVDDVRAYHLPERCAVWTLGRQALPAGILLQPQALARLFARQGDAAKTVVDVEDENEWAEND